MAVFGLTAQRDTEVSNTFESSASALGTKLGFAVKPRQWEKLVKAFFTAKKALSKLLTQQAFSDIVESLRGKTVLLIDLEPELPSPLLLRENKVL